MKNQNIIGGRQMRRILIVEDDEKLRGELEIFLNKNGYQKAIKDFDRYTNNISLYDYTILNTETGADRLSTMLQDLSGIEPKSVHREKNIKKQKARIYVFIGSPWAGTSTTVRISSDSALSA